MAPRRLRTSAPRSAGAFAPATASQGYTPNELNRYRAAGGVAHGYDANGNLTSDGTKTFIHAGNRLTHRKHDGSQQNAAAEGRPSYSAAIWAESSSLVSSASATAAIRRQVPSKPGPGARRSASR